MAFLSAYDHLQDEHLASHRLGLDILGLIAGSIAIYVACIVYRHLEWPAHTRSCPPHQSFINRSASSSVPSDFATLYPPERWVEKYGPTLRYSSSGGRPAIMTVDPKALRHILSSPAYEKGEGLKHFFEDILGDDVHTPSNRHRYFEHGVTSAAVTWGLHALSSNPRVQETLRSELLSVPSDPPAETELNALAYLDAVVREMLRVHAPVYITDRSAVKDDIVPLKTAIIGPDGRLMSEIHVSKGDMITFPLQLINRMEEYWGKDASQFRPERWSRLPDTAKDLPGVFSNTLTFFAGTHACIGYRFSIVEMKAMLFDIVREFEFGPPVAESLNARRKPMAVAKPSLTSRGWEPAVSPRSFGV